MHSSSKTTLGADHPAAAELELPRSIGPYAILRLLGEGGMGTVYLARETQPDRLVALKVVRAFSHDAGERLRREIDVLAQLEHANIARLYAAGEAEVGGRSWPWLALEYVEGLDLLAHAQTRSLDVAARLRLLIAVCRAVHHAHLRGVVHRDLKPGNILVDAEGAPRVLDFGIARLLEDAGPGMTEVGQVLGTVPYMSPEQFGGDSRHIDARSDVYALGVVAYELLSGRLPHPRIGRSSLFEAVDIVRNERPPPLDAVMPGTRGDLSLVVMKALEADPARRYASASDFADDLAAVLEHRPVQARAPTRAYLLSRFVQRHRALSATIAAAVVVLLVATIVSLRFAFAEARARGEAEARSAEAAAVNGFLTTMLASADPSIARGRELGVADVIDLAESNLADLDAQPRVRASVLDTLAATRAGLGQYEAALTLTDRALAGADGAALDAAARARLLRQRASMLTELGRFDEADEAIESARAQMPTSAPALERLGLELTAARLDQEAGRADQAVKGLRAVLDGAAALDTASLDATARTRLADLIDVSRGNLSIQLSDMGVVDEAVVLLTASLDARRARHGDDDPRTLASRHKLASLEFARGRLDIAEAEARATLAAQRRVLGDAHAATLTTMQTLANVLLSREQLDEGEALTREALAGFEKLLGDAHAQTLASMNALAYLLEQRQRLDEAEALYRRVLAIDARSGDTHPTTFAPRNNLAMLLLDRGQGEAALDEFRTLVAGAEAALGDAHPHVAIFRSNLGLCLSKLGRDAEAISVLETAHARLGATLGPTHARTRKAAERLADVLARNGRGDEAARLRATASP
ncbi:MAG TPA: tetratricopeptide repeat protein [Dokdonella sp.]|nr:tetratricopeptide repeat protein [Dokdonella sp.]